MVVSCNSESKIYAVRIKETSWELIDAADDEVIYLNEKEGGFTHVTCNIGSIFFVKGKEV